MMCLCFFLKISMFLSFVDNMAELLIFLTEIQKTYNILLVLGVQHSNSIVLTSYKLDSALENLSFKL